MWLFFFLSRCVLINNNWCIPVFPDRDNTNPHVPFITLKKNEWTVCKGNSTDNFSTSANDNSQSCYMPLQVYIKKGCCGSSLKRIMAPVGITGTDSWYARSLPEHSLTSKKGVHFILGEAKKKKLNIREKHISKWVLHVSTCSHPQSSSCSSFCFLGNCRLGNIWFI